MQESPWPGQLALLDWRPMAPKLRLDCARERCDCTMSLAEVADALPSYSTCWFCTLPKDVMPSSRTFGHQERAHLRKLSHFLCNFAVRRLGSDSRAPRTERRAHTWHFPFAAFVFAQSKQPEANLQPRTLEDCSGASPLRFCV